eukprot:COSAG02_NODE_1984_length_10186_cov_6.109933_5_plen_33_part_00
MLSLKQNLKRTDSLELHLPTALGSCHYYRRHC